MAKNKSKTRRSSDAESVTSTASNSSRTASAGPIRPGSPRSPENGSNPKRKSGASAMNTVHSPLGGRVDKKQSLPVVPNAQSTEERQKKVVNFQSSDFMDFYSVGWILYDLGVGTHVCDCFSNSDSNHCVQGGYCTSERSRSRKEDTFLQGSELV